MPKHKTIINFHAKHYIADVFEKRLREEGFVCPDDKLLCWYRMHGENIVNSLIFFSPWSNLPLMMFVGYGIHPLFSEPVISRNVHFTKRPIYDDRFIEQGIVENVPINSMGYSMYSPDIAVDAPGHAGRGIYTLDGIILPHMKKVRSIEEAYTFHKERRLNLPRSDNEQPEDRLGELSRTFIDMALWVDDSEMYDMAARWTAHQTDLFESIVAKFPQRQQYAQELKAWKRLQEVFENNERDQYVAELVQAMDRNAKVLQKKYLKGMTN